MGRNLTKEDRREIARARFRIILPLLRIRGEERCSLIKEICRVPHDIPFSKKEKISAATLYRWIETFEKGGEVDALMPAERSDKGKSRVIEENLLSELKNLKKELPQRSARKLIRIVELTGGVKEGLIKKPTLLRILREHGYTRWMLSSKLKKARRKWQRAAPNSLWMGDFMTADIWLPDPEDGGKIKQLHFCCYLDDRSRFCPHGEFFFDEKLPCLETTFKKALSKRGIPDEVYYDGGKTFQSDQMKAICYELGINPIDSHSAESRGKVEKFNQFVQMDFIAEIVHAGVKILEAVNKRFLHWLEEEYHKKIHKEIGERPIDAWNEIKDIRTVTPEKLEQVFLWREKRTVSPTCLIPYNGNSYETKPELANKKVQIRFNPFDLSKLYVYLNGEFHSEAKPFKLVAQHDKRVRHEKGEKPKPDEEFRSSISYFSALEEKTKGAKPHEAVIPLINEEKKEPVKEKPEEFPLKFSKGEFFEELTRHLGCLGRRERRKVNLLWSETGPFDEKLTREAIGRTLKFKGNSQHISYYLEAIRREHMKRAGEIELYPRNHDQVMRVSQILDELTEKMAMD